LGNVYTNGDTLLETINHAEEVLESMLEVNVTPKGKKGDFKRELVNELNTEDGA